MILTYARNYHMLSWLNHRRKYSKLNHTNYLFLVRYTTSLSLTLITFKCLIVDMAKWMIWIPVKTHNIVIESSSTFVLFR